MVIPQPSRERAMAVTQVDIVEDSGKAQLLFTSRSRFFHMIYEMFLFFRSQKLVSVNFLWPAKVSAA